MPRRTDANHRELSEALRSLGWRVHDTHMLGRGFPDIVIGRRGVNVLVEIKTAAGVLTDAEQRFFARWPGPCEIVRTVDDCERLTARYDPEHVLPRHLRERGG